MGTRRLVCLLITNLFSIIGSLLIICAMFYFIITFSGYVYELNNPQIYHNGIIEDDLGIGFVGLASLIVSCFCSIPVFYFSYRFLYKLTMKYIGGRLC